MGNFVSSFCVRRVGKKEEPIETGMVAPFAGAVIPNGWLICDGSAVSRDQHKKLFEVISTIYGEGDGETTFNLPDLRGEFVRGCDLDRGIDDGRQLGSPQDDMIRGHTHSATAANSGAHKHALQFRVGGSSTDHNSTELLTGSGYPSSSSCVNKLRVSSTPMETTGMHSHSITVSQTGGHETRPRNVAMLYCIKC